MADTPELHAARQRWREKEPEQELALYEFVLEETPATPNDGLYRYEEGRVIPKLAVAALQIRDHSRSLIRLTWVLVGLTGVLASLTVILIYVTVK